MRKMLILFIVLTFLVSFVTVVGAAEKIEVKFTMAAVPGTVHHDAVHVFKEELESLADNIEVTIFHSGSLYTQDQQQDALRRGQVEMGYLTPWFLSDHIPEISMFTAGYLFESYEHMNSVLNGEIGKDVFKKVAKQFNARPLNAFYLGSRQLNYRDVNGPVIRPEDLSGMTFRMPNSPSWLFLGRAMGMSPTPLPIAEVYMALNTGTIDGQDNPLPTNKARNFNEVTDYITLTNHIIDSVWFSVNEDFWQSLSPELQAKFYEASEKARQYAADTNLTLEQELVEFFEEEGLTVVEADIDAFKTNVQEAYLGNEDMTSSWDMDLFNRIQNMAK